ncbi:HRDC domain-containing protein [Deinococcus sp. NW-56]|uniref:HRDC domain-containing protein n=1 Tax=Deinococcus sp. NW-56 TaxID=2080419 RepID=UPI000CF3B5BA|nr:HRDC domain-containing protein [Deinococcus sp. NW-56]
MTADFPSPPTRPDARLVALHAERGDPHARLAGALADLEGAGWGLTLAGEPALARQLGTLLGPGTVRVDERLGVSRAALANFGLAAAGLDADWTGARAVWLAEPDERLLRRAERAGVPVIVDATLAPGGGWFAQGATYVVYRHGVTLTGFGDTDLALLFGQGEAPTPAAPAPSDTAVALALRDVATLPLRLARVARTVGALAERLGGGALPFGPTALLLPPDSAPDTPWVPGGVLAATRSVDGGVVFTPGLQDTETALALLRGGAPTAPAPVAREQAEDRRPEREDESRFRRNRDRFGRDRGDRSGRSTDGVGAEAPRPSRPPAPDRPEPDAARPDQPQPDSAPTRVTFEAPTPDAPAPQAPTPAEPEEEVWTPEIVFSGSGHEDPAPLPIPVSAGPDEPELEVQPPLAGPEAEPAEEPATDEAPVMGDAAPEPQPDPVPATPDLAPDLPVTTEAGAAPDPAADLTDEQAAIYARLREWRNAEAKRQEVSRFIIASNATLAEIARRVPYTMDDLKAVRGMGPERLRKYGEKLLEVVRG